MTTSVWANSNSAADYEVGSPVWNPSSFRCHLAITKDDETFSAVVLNLPGAGSCGDTEEDLIANVREAVAALIESYAEDLEEIPWIDTTQYSVPEGSQQKWILVDV